MTSKLRRDYGAPVLDSVISRIAANPLRPYSFSNSVKKFTRLNTRQLHDQTVEELEKLWARQLSQIETKDYPVLNNRPTAVPSDYYLPVAVSSDTILALKQSRDQVPAFVMIDSGRKEKGY